LEGSPRDIQNYLGPISCLLLDRMDLQVEVPALPYREIARDRTAGHSAQIREGALATYRRQQRRFADNPKTTGHARMGRRGRKHFCVLNQAGLELPRHALTEPSPVVGADDRILKVDRTIANPAGAEKFGPEQGSEGVQYRSLDRPLLGRGIPGQEL